MATLSGTAMSRAQELAPVVRSLAYALLNHSGEPNPAESDLEADRPWRRNEELARKLGAYGEKSLYGKVTGRNETA